MRKLLTLMAATLLAAGGTAIPATAAPPPQPTCGSTITRSVTLTTDLLDCPGDGLIIAGNRITLDLGGHTLGGNGPSERPSTGPVAIRLDGHQDVKIVNGTIKDFDNGIFATNARRVSLRNLTVWSDAKGVHFTNVDHSSIRRSTFDARIVLTDADHNEISDNDADAAPDGTRSVLLENSHHNVIRRNDLMSDDTVVDLEHSNGNRVEDNTARWTGTGIRLRWSNDNWIRRNRVDGEANAIEVTDSSRNRIEFNHGNDFTSDIVVAYGTGNRVRRNTSLTMIDVYHATGTLVEDNGVNMPTRERWITPDVGNIYLTSSFDTVVRGNTAISVPITASHGTVVRDNLLIAQTRIHYPTVDGITVDADSSASVLIANTAIGHTNDGIHVDAPDTYLRANQADDNGDLGIDAVPGVTDGGHNRAAGNGNPLQCIGVTCT